MPHRLDIDTLNAATEEARRLNSPTVEAEHILLALAADGDSPAGRLLAEVGLDHEGVLAALERETERSLGAVGVSLAAFAPPSPSPSRRPPAASASFRRAMEQAVQLVADRRDRGIGAAHLLAGVLRAEIGTVPRALAEAGVDRVALLARAEQLPQP